MITEFIAKKRLGTYDDPKRHPKGWKPDTSAVDSRGRHKPARYPHGHNPFRQPPSKPMTPKIVPTPKKVTPANAHPITPKPEKPVKKPVAKPVVPAPKPAPVKPVDGPKCGAFVRADCAAPSIEK